MVKQAHVINPLCDVQIFPTEHECGKHDINRAISTEVSLTLFTIPNSAFLCLKRHSKGNTLVTGHHSMLIIYS